MIDFGMGVGPQSLEGPGTQSASAGPFVDLFQSPLLDLTQVVSNIELVPARPNLIPFPVNLVTAFWFVEQRSGTQTSPPTIQAGSDAAHQNFFTTTSTTPSNANLNASVVPAPIAGPGIGVFSGTLKRIPNAPIMLDLTVPAAGTGGYSCRARIFVVVAWIALSQ